MNILKLSTRSLRARPAATSVSLILLSLGVAIISLLFLLNEQLEEKFQKNISGIDMVVGAKGSPLQLILSAVFQIDYPTGNIKLSEARGLQRNRYIERAIPLAYGDSYQGYRLVGTDSSYLNLYEAELSAGRTWAAPYEVVLGSQVAEATGLKVGDSFYSAHGVVAGAAEHDAHPYTITGILKSSNAVPDGLILTSVESIWAVHEHEEGATPDSTAQDERELTAMLIKFRSPMGMVMLPRQVNERTNMQAAIPAMEINRLFSLLGIGIDLLKAIAFSIILIAGLSFFLSLYSSLRERKYELALMRSIGASRSKIVGLVVLEGILLSVAGYILGLVLGHSGLALLSSMSEGAYGYGFEFMEFTQDELVLGASVLLVGFLAAIIPAIKAMRTPISETLARS